VEIFKNKAESSVLRVESLRALAAFKDASLGSLLKAAADDPDAEVRKAAGSLQAKLSPGNATTVVLRLLDVGENEHTYMEFKIVYRRDRFGRGGDHISFLEQGFRSAVRFTEVNENFDHQHQNVRVEDGKQIGDLPEFVDFEYVARVARVNAATLAALADAPGAPKDVRIAGGLGYDTSLRWAANPEPDLAGYEIVLRETTDDDWRGVIRVGNVTSYVVPNMSKDNYFFGVRAVDDEGNRSPVVFPVP
jgi:hypothetical protein